MPSQWIPKSPPNPKKSSTVPLQTPSRERSQKKRAKSAPPDPPGTLECSKTTTGSSKNRGLVKSIFSHCRLPFGSLCNHFGHFGAKMPPGAPKKKVLKNIENTFRKNTGNADKMVTKSLVFLPGDTVLGSPGALQDPSCPRVP